RGRGWQLLQQTVLRRSQYRPHCAAELRAGQWPHFIGRRAGWAPGSGNLGQEPRESRVPVLWAGPAEHPGWRVGLRLHAGRAAQNVWHRYQPEVLSRQLRGQPRAKKALGFMTVIVRIWSSVTPIRRRRGIVFRMLKRLPDGLRSLSTSIVPV